MYKLKTTTKITVKGNKFTAVVTDENSNGVVGVKVIFTIGKKVIGIGTTDTNGVAIIYHQHSKKKPIGAKFPGNDKYYESYDVSNHNAFSSVAMKETGLSIIPILLALINSILFVIYKKHD